MRGVVPLKSSVCATSSYIYETSVTLKLSDTFEEYRLVFLLPLVHDLS